MAETEVQINPVQIVYMTYQLRQAEIQRNDTKNARNRQAMTLHINKLKQELDPLLEMFAEQEKKKRKENQMVVDRNMEDKDIGPEEVVAAMHTYAQMKITQEAVVNHLATGQPLSIAGDYNKIMYVIHFEQAKDGK